MQLIECVCKAWWHKYYIKTYAGVFCRAGKGYWALFFFPNFKWKVQVLKIHSLFVLSEKKEIDFKSNGIDSSLECKIMRS